MISGHIIGMGILAQLLFWGVLMILAARPVGLVAIPHEVRYVNPTAHDPPRAVRR